MAVEVALECLGLGCGYPERPVLRDICFSATPGETIALIGVNGSGKSTLLRTIAKLVAPLAGEIRVCNRVLASLHFNDLARLVASVPQEEPAVFPFRVEEVIAMARIAYGSGIFDTEEDRSAAQRAMETAHCMDLAGRVVTKLSGGERQRVLIARAIAQDTPLILMDEPTAHLDASHQISTAELIGKMAALGKTVLVAVHDLNLAPLIGNRALLLSNGGIVMDGPTEEVLGDPMLDEAYGVRFERVRTESGRLFVVPTSRV
jgi:iron complex transport system ATP-binding protein